MGVNAPQFGGGGSATKIILDSQVDDQPILRGYDTTYELPDTANDLTLRLWGWYDLATSRVNSLEDASLTFGPIDWRFVQDGEEAVYLVTDDISRRNYGGGETLDDALPNDAAGEVGYLVIQERPYTSGTRRQWFSLYYVPSINSMVFVEQIQGVLPSNVAARMPRPHIAYMVILGG